MRKILKKISNDEKIDDTDKKIIRMLQDNGRLSDTKLAEGLGISNDTARRKREALEKEGIIRIRAIIDPKLLGYVHYLHCSVSTKSNVDTRTFAKRMSKNEMVYYVALSMGPRPHVLIHYREKTENALYDFIEKLRSDPEVDSIDVNVIFDVIKSGYHSVPLD